MEDFVTFEIAKKLEEKGFDWDTSEIFERNILACRYEDCRKPTIPQVLKWLREEHHLHFEVVGAAYGYNLIVSDTPAKGGTDRYYSHANDDGSNYAGAWDKYEDCVLYGIKYVLENLI
jgi:hypothetical protein